MTTARHNLAAVTTADFIVRAAYQMGKTPLLPLFAAALGASDAYLGLIVSVSTLTGMIFKPLVGALSDRWGRRRWMLVALLFFVLTPFGYHFVETPAQLLVVRLIHGLATAIFGPVTVAYVVELAAEGQAERVGWFSLARSGGYIVGPAVAGWLLLYLAPTSIFTAIGLISALALVPLLALPVQGPEGDPVPVRVSVSRQLRQALAASGRAPALWVAAGLEALLYLALYAVKTFLPLYAVSTGANTAEVGLYFAFQEGASVVLKPAGGRLGDRLRYSTTISAGIGLLGVSLWLITYLSGNHLFFLPALLSGAAQALIVPSTVALVSTSVGGKHLGASLGMLGAWRNASKVAGPVLGGLLMASFTFANTFRLWGIGLLLFSLLLLAALHFGPWKFPTASLEPAQTGAPQTTMHRAAGTGRSPATQPPATPGREARAQMSADPTTTVAAVLSDKASGVAQREAGREER